MGSITISINLEVMLLRLASDVGLDRYSTYYCRLRLRSEGVQFMTITLPKLAKSILRSLETGFFDRPTCFAWKGRSLRHFRSLLNRIFDPRTGKVLSDVDALALQQVRQFCEYVYKLALDFSEDQLADAESEFISDEEDLKSNQIDVGWVEKLRKDFETYYPEISTAEVKDVFNYARPRPGNGTYAGCDDTWYLKRYRDRHPTAEWSGHEGYFKPYPSCTAIKVRRRGETSSSSEVLFVPKDSRGPRVIVREPYRLSLVHLSFHDWVTDALERLTRGRVNFRDQQVNRSLAEQSSRDKKWATIDLKKASDMVDSRICRRIFRNSPAIRTFVGARSKEAVLPSGETVTLTKLAGMGSGLTFPVMSLLITLSISRHLSNRTGMSYTKARDLVYVYGDDIIVPSCYYTEAIEAIKRVGLTPNCEKSYIHSHFRESCGGDYYHGQDVAPVRLKLSSCKLSYKGLTLQLKTSFAVVNLERHCRELVKSGMLDLSGYYYSCLERAVGKLPEVSGESPVIGRYKILTPSYDQDSNGNYLPIRVMLPTAVTVSEKICPYIYLSTKIKVIDKKPWFLSVDSSSSQSFGEVAVPRKVKISRKRVSSFRCMG